MSIFEIQTPLRVSVGSSGFVAAGGGGGTYVPAASAPTIYQAPTNTASLPSGNQIQYNLPAVSSAITSNLATNPNQPIGDILVPAVIVTPQGYSVSDSSLPVTQDGFIRVADIQQNDPNFQTNVVQFNPNLTESMNMLSRQQAPTPVPGTPAAQVPVQPAQFVPEMESGPVSSTVSTPSSTSGGAVAQQGTQPVTTTQAVTDRPSTPEDLQQMVTTASQMDRKPTQVADQIPAYIAPDLGEGPQEPSLVRQTTSEVQRLQAPRIGGTAAQPSQVETPEGATTLTSAQEQGQAALMSLGINPNNPNANMEITLVENTLRSIPKDERPDNYDQQLRQINAARAYLPTAMGQQKEAYRTQLDAQIERLQAEKIKVTNSTLPQQSRNLVISDIDAAISATTTARNDQNISAQTVSQVSSNVDNTLNYNARYAGRVIENKFFYNRTFDGSVEYNGANVAYAFSMGLSTLGMMAGIYQQTQQIKEAQQAREDELAFRREQLQLQKELMAEARGGGGGGGGGGSRGGRIEADPNVRL